MLNHIVIMGRLTKEPELRTTSSGTSVASFTVAVARDFGTQKETDFIDCVAWRQTAEFISKYFHKGSMIVVSGRMQSRKYQDREGNNRVAWDIQAENVYFGESKRDSEGSSYSQSSYSSQGNSYGNYNQAGQTSSLPKVTEDAYSGLSEIEDDGELPF